MSETLIKLTGLWERERRGNPPNTYWVGRLGAAKILVFKNNRKESDSDPDFNVFLTESSPPRQERPSRDAERGRTSYEAVSERAESSRPAGPGAGVLAGAGRSSEPLVVEPIPPGGDQIDE